MAERVEVVVALRAERARRELKEFERNLRETMTIGERVARVTGNGAFRAQGQGGGFLSGAAQAGARVAGLGDTARVVGAVAGGGAGATVGLLTLIAAAVKEIITAIAALGELIKRFFGPGFVGQALSDVGRKLNEAVNKLEANVARTKALEVNGRFAAAGLGPIGVGAVGDFFYEQRKVELGGEERKRVRDRVNAVDGIKQIMFGG